MRVGGACCESNKMTDDRERKIALGLLETLVDLVGDTSTMTVDLWELHRIILVMRGVVLEADENFALDVDFDRVSTALAPLIAAEAKRARAFRKQNGIGLMDLILRSKTDYN